MRSTTIRNLLHVEPQIYWGSLFFDLGYSEALYDALGFEHFSVLDQRRLEGGDVRRVLRGQPPLNVPGVLKRRLDGHVYYEEDGTFHAAEQLWRFVSRPSVVPDQIDIRGEIRLHDHPEGCLHELQLHVHVTAWGLGALVERVIERNTRQSYAIFTEFTNRYAEHHGLAKP